MITKQLSNYDERDNGSLFKLKFRSKDICSKQWNRNLQGKPIQYMKLNNFICINLYLYKWLCFLLVRQHEHYVNVSVLIFQKRPVFLP